jgi:predicted dehydrogenase
MLLLDFENGAQGSIQLSAMAHIGDRGQEQHVILHGKSGTIEAHQTFLGSEIQGARQDEKQIQPLPVPDRLWAGVDRTASYFDRLFAVFQRQPVGDRAFIDAILAARPVAPSFYDGFKAQQVIDAAIASHERGCWVSLGEWSVDG